MCKCLLMFPERRYASARDDWLELVLRLGPATAPSSQPAVLCHHDRASTEIKRSVRAPRLHSVPAARTARPHTW